MKPFFSPSLVSSARGADEGVIAGVYRVSGHLVFPTIEISRPRFRFSFVFVSFVVSVGGGGGVRVRVGGSGCGGTFIRVALW